MYDDSWYNILPDPQPRRDTAAIASTKHRRRESLLQQPNDGSHIALHQSEPLAEMLEDSSLLKGPPKATLKPRSNSYSKVHRIKRSQVTKDAMNEKYKSNQQLSIMNNQWDKTYGDSLYGSEFEDRLLDASQEEFALYRDQMRLTERHLDTLIEDTTSALSLLAGLSESFDAVEKETTAFQSQCELLLEDQKRLKKLESEVGDNLRYYSYLEPITRRLNAPGASRLVRDEGFVEMLMNLNNCISFMSNHPNQRESETYLARYTSLLQRALNLFESQLKKDLDDRLEDIRKRRAEGTLNATTLHALLYRPMSSEMENNIRFIGEWAAGVAEQTPHLGSYAPESSIARSSSSGSFVAQNQLQSTIRGIANWRLALLTPSIQELVDTLNRAVEEKEDAIKASRTCIKGVLDLCLEELKLFHRFFPTEVWAVLDRANPVANYTAYLDDLCKQATDVVAQIVGRADLQDAVQLTSWVDRCYVQDFSYYDNKQHPLLSDAILFEDRREQITFKMSLDIKEVILTRFDEIVLRKIEKYEPAQQDLEIAPAYVDRRESLSGTKVSASPKRAVPDGELDELDHRAIEIIGAGYLTAYPPIKSATRMLVLHNEMFPAPSGDESIIVPTNHAVEKSRFNIIHHAVASIDTAVNRILRPENQAIKPGSQPTTAKATDQKGKLGNPSIGFHHHLFAIHNLYLLKQLILVYELHGVTKTSELDFSDLWTTLRDLRDRGRLLDPMAYYDLVREGKLMPKVLEKVSDARVELDGILRSSIVKFTQGWAGRIVEVWKKEGREEGGGSDDASFEELRWILGWTLVGEEQLRDGLILAVKELCENGVKEGWMLPLRLSGEKMRE